MIVIAHNYVHVLEMCDRVNLLRNGRIMLDKRTDETSVEELTEIVAAEYRQPPQAPTPSWRQPVGGRKPAGERSCRHRSGAGRDAGAADGGRLSKEGAARYVHIIGLFDPPEAIRNA